VTTPQQLFQSTLAGKAARLAQIGALLVRRIADRVDAFLDAEAERYGRNWWKRFGQSTAVGVLAVVVLHFVIVGALRSGALVRVVVVGGTLLAGLLFSCVLLWMYLRARSRPADIRPYVVAVLIGSVTTAVALEAFCAGQLLLWRSDAVSPLPEAGDPSFWRVERSYGWHLLNSIPLLSVPKTLGLDKPALFGDQVSGGLLLAFKLVVLVPLIGLAVSGYQVAEQQLAKLREAHTRRAAREGNRLLEGDRGRDIWKFALMIALIAAGAIIIVRLALAPSSPVRDIGADAVPSDLTVRDITIPLDWADHVVVPLVGLGLFWLEFVAVGHALGPVEPKPPGSAASAVGWSIAVFSCLVLATAVIVGMTLGLMRTGVSVPPGGVDDDAVLGVALSFHVWHVLDGVPGLEIPQTLNWDLEHDLHDPWSGTVLLLYKAILLFTVIFVTTRVVGPQLRARSGTRAGALVAASDFDALAEQIGDRLEQDERKVLEGDHLFNRSAPGLLRRLDRTSTDVRALFGSSDVTEHADAVVTVLSRRSERLEPHQLFMSWPDNRSNNVIREDQAASAAVLKDYRRAARKALRRVVGPIEERGG
jgi:hypothetical protein